MEVDERFRQLYEAHAGEILGVFMSRGYTADRALELSQDTFLRVYRNLGKRIENPRAWLLQAAKNVALNDQRAARSGKRTGTTVSLETLEDGSLPARIIQSHEDVLKRLTGRELIRRLARAVGDLPPSFEEAVRLFLAGWTHVEIAVVLKTTAGTVKTRLYKARQRLRKQLLEEDGFLESPPRR